MSFTRTGLILYVQRYSKCVRFYEDILELNILFQTPELKGRGYGLTALPAQS